MIETRDVRVDYHDVTAVSDLSVSIDKGEVFGLIGPNGAGKTSTIRVMATLQEPTYGDVKIGGFDVQEQRHEIHRILGYMPDMPPVYDDLRCWEFLDLFAGAYFVDRRERRRRVEKCLDDVNLSTKRNVMAGTLSRGMSQRLVLAKTMLPDPEVMLLDEPASGLDPIARIELRNLLVEQAGRGKTILVSSHILTELEGFCTSIGIMQKGEMLIDGSIEGIIGRLNRKKRLHIQCIEPPPNLIEKLNEYHGVSNAESANDGVEFEFDGTRQEEAELLAQMIADGIRLYGFRELRMGVEDIMMEVDAKEVS